MTGTCDDCGTRGTHLRFGRWCHNCYRLRRKHGELPGELATLPSAARDAAARRARQLEDSALAGLSARQLAERLGLSVRTIQRYRARNRARQAG